MYKRRSGLVQDLWVIQEAPVGIEGREKGEMGRGRSIYAKQPASCIICMHWTRMWVRESRNVACVHGKYAGEYRREVTYVL